MNAGNYGTIAWELGSLRRLIKYCDVDSLCAKMNQQFKEVHSDVIMEMTDRVENNRLQRCAGGCPVYTVPWEGFRSGRLGGSVVGVSRSADLIGCMGARFVSSRPEVSGSAI